MLKDLVILVISTGLGLIAGVFGFLLFVWFSPLFYC